MTFARLIRALPVIAFLFAHQTQACPAYIEPEIEVIPSMATPNLNSAYSARQLEALQYKTGSYQHEEIPSGLTTFGQNIKSAYEFREATQPDGSVCAQVSHITLTLAIENLTVHVASELPMGTCSYKTILDHEMKHVHTAQRFLDGAVAPATRQLKRLIDGIGMIHTQSSAEARNYIKQTVGDFINTLSQNLIIVCNTMEQEIDTKEEYERLSKACHGEMATFGRRVRRY
ncbi:MAG: hypothetical protein PHS57_05150 [Alphaproteobacteria bacterium]|nr:hypothetical protein [Alphaproteobacteria bacterium]